MEVFDEETDIIFCKKFGFYAYEFTIYNFEREKVANFPVLIDFMKLFLLCRCSGSDFLIQVKLLL